MIVSEVIELQTRGFSEIVDLTPSVVNIIKKVQMENGVVTVFCPGSTGAVTTIEYEGGVLEDLKKAVERLVPADLPYAHDSRWGDGNGFAHVRAALLGPSLAVPLIAGSLALGTWQQIVFIDFDNRRRQRKIIVQVMGEVAERSLPFGKGGARDRL